MDYTYQEYREWVKTIKHPLIVRKNEMLPYLVKRFEKQKKELLFKSIQESGFKLRKSSYGLYTNGDFQNWLESGNVHYVSSSKTGLPKENSIKNKQLYRMFLEYQQLHGEQ